MRDAAYVDKILEKGREAKQKTNEIFRDISLTQLNWKASPQSWSMGQCLDHLIHANSAYFGDLEKITTGHYRKSFWQKITPLTRWWGGVFKKQLSENVVRKLKAPKDIRPASSDLSLDIIDKYRQNLDRFLGYFSKCKETDLEKTVITSPFLSIVTYNLRDVMQFLVNHEHRHLNQALRVRSNTGFPS